MRSLKYSITRGTVMTPVAKLDLNPDYLASYKVKIEKQLATFLKQIVNDEAEIELTVAPNGKEILYWKVANWNAEGYDKLITSNLI